MEGLLAGLSEKQYQVEHCRKELRRAKNAVKEQHRALREHVCTLYPTVWVIQCLVDIKSPLCDIKSSLIDTRLPTVDVKSPLLDDVGSPTVGISQKKELPGLFRTRAEAEDEFAFKTTYYDIYSEPEYLEKDSVEYDLPMLVRCLPGFQLVAELIRE